MRPFFSRYLKWLPLPAVFILEILHSKISTSSRIKITNLFRNYLISLLYLLLGLRNPIPIRLPPQKCYHTYAFYDVQFYYIWYLHVQFFHTLYHFFQLYLFFYYSPPSNATMCYAKQQSSNITLLSIPPFLFISHSLKPKYTLPHKTSFVCICPSMVIKFPQKILFSTL